MYCPFFFFFSVLYKQNKTVLASGTTKSRRHVPGSRPLLRTTTALLGLPPPRHAGGLTARHKCPTRKTSSPHECHVAFLVINVFWRRKAFLPRQLAHPHSPRPPTPSLSPSHPHPASPQPTHTLLAHPYPASPHPTHTLPPRAFGSLAAAPPSEWTNQRGARPRGTRRARHI